MIRRHAGLTHCDLAEGMKFIIVIVIIVGLVLNVNDGFTRVVSMIIVGIGIVVVVRAVIARVDIDIHVAFVVLALTEATEAR